MSKVSSATPKPSLGAGWPNGGHGSFDARQHDADVVEAVWRALPDASRDDLGKLTRRQLREALRAAGLLPRAQAGTSA